MTGFFRPSQFKERLATKYLSSLAVWASQTQSVKNDNEAVSQTQIVGPAEPEFFRWIVVLNKLVNENDHDVTGEQGLEHSFSTYHGRRGGLIRWLSAVS